VHNSRHVRDVAEGDESADHAWFASFAPAKKPEIAVVVLIEHGGFGAKAATPVAMEMVEGYFGLKGLAVSH
jgi:penicillin-binding protein 2